MAKPEGEELLGRTPNTPDGGVEFKPGIIQRVLEGVRYMGTGEKPAWFGPNLPLPPAAPDSVKGRPWDFPMGVNLQYTPRADQGDTTIDFATLRRVSDPVQGGLDLLRCAIETRKDQMEAQKHVIKGRDGKDGGDRARKIEVALRRPDLVHTYRQWARPIWDDLLVIDAPAIYMRPIAPRDGQVFLPEQIDGATVKILIDQNGRTPLPPDAAYQQVIKGLPAVNYTLDELLYIPRNLRSYRFYGMGPVEQVLGIANIALKRQLHLLNYYTSGTVPDAIVTPPVGWNPDQVKQAQQWMDQLTAPSARHKVRIIPGGDFTQLRDPKLKDEMDDWLARIICYAFSLPPGALVKDMTKAASGTNAQTAHEEGLEPFKLWWKDVMDEILARCFGAEDLEFAYQDEEINDAQVKMTIWTGYKAAGVVTADEVRDKALGLDPMTDEQKAETKPPAPLVAPGDPGGNPTDKPGTTQGEVDGSASPLPPAKKAWTVEDLLKFNENHGEDGKFTSGDGDGRGAVTYSQATGASAAAIKATKAAKKSGSKKSHEKALAANQHALAQHQAAIKGSSDQTKGIHQAFIEAHAAAIDAHILGASIATKLDDSDAHADGLQKKKTTIPRIDHGRPAVAKGESAVTKLFKARFAKQRKALVAAVKAEAQKLLKMDQDDMVSLWDSLSAEGKDKLRKAISKELKAVAKDGADVALRGVLDAVGPTDADLEAMLSQANEQAIAFAEERGSELVGMKWDHDSGAWIENPKAEWAIDETTRERIRDLVVMAEDNGWSNGELASAIQEDAAFSDSRAEMIARTETAFADIQGNLAGWEASGVVESKEWSVSQDEVCDECMALDGQVVGLDEQFPDGDPPLHPNCRCDLLPVVISQGEIDAETA